MSALDIVTEALILQIFNYANDISDTAPEYVEWKALVDNLLTEFISPNLTAVDFIKNTIMNNYDSYPNGDEYNVSIPEYVRTQILTRLTTLMNIQPGPDKNLGAYDSDLMDFYTYIGGITGCMETDAANYDENATFQIAGCISQQQSAMNAFTNMIEGDAIQVTATTPGDMDNIYNFLTTNANMMSALQNPDQAKNARGKFIDAFGQIADDPNYSNFFPNSWNTGMLNIGTSFHLEPACTNAGMSNTVGGVVNGDCKSQNAEGGIFPLCPINDSTLCTTWDTFWTNLINDTKNEDHMFIDQSPPAGSSWASPYSLEDLINIYTGNTAPGGIFSNWTGVTIAGFVATPHFITVRDAFFYICQ